MERSASGGVSVWKKAPKPAGIGSCRSKRLPVRHSPTWTDDPRTNTITIVDNFSLPAFWKPSAGKDVYRGEFAPFLLKTPPTRNQTF